MMALLSAGFLTRFTAASLAVIMLGAITMVHLPYELVWAAARGK
jgi:uncharacterized membrane protein YphA (DoxX/SURF4 family)